MSREYPALGGETPGFRPFEEGVSFGAWRSRYEKVRIGDDSL
jgi:hypothetical protein